VTWGKSLLLMIPLAISGIIAVPTAASSAQVGGTGAWAAVSAGGGHSCAVSTARSLYCWGHNVNGQIGDGTTTQRTTPKKIGASGVWVGATAGGNHSCAVTTGKTLYCWGRNSTGQVGDNTTVQRRTPQKIGAHTMSSTGAHHTCALNTARSIFCWGQPFAPAGSTPPSDILDLTQWKLQAPENTDEISSNPDEIRIGGNPNLVGFNHPDYFHSNGIAAAGVPANGGVYFRAPADGATTSGTAYARSELREMDGNQNAGWTNADGKIHSMTVQQAITHLPDGKKKHLVAGQIHGTSNDVLQLRLEDKKLFVEVRDEAAAGNPLKGTANLTTNYQLGTLFTVQITVDGTGVKVFYNGNPTPALTVNHVGAPDAKWYFKAGVYIQSCQPVAGSCTAEKYGTGYGEVLVKSLTIAHQP
jgi:hypothetical protein